MNLTVALVSLTLALCSNPLETEQIILHTTKADYPLTVEIADTGEKRETGLMGRTSLDKGKGMLFIFPDKAPRQFWMKNTLIPLDIIFFDSNKRVIHLVENMEPCKKPQCIKYPSEGAAMYVLEVPSGFIRTHGVKLGDSMSS